MGDKGTLENDVGFIRALAELLRANDLTEVEVKRDYGENDRLTVRVARGGPALAAPVHSPGHAPAYYPGPGYGPGAAAPAATAAVTGAASDPAQLPGAVTSPMVGTVYLQPEPGASPFVTVGQSVKAGDTLLIIEAMKTMNQIPAPHAGVVRRILVEDGAPVEYGAPLMVID
jgi:acetyl-CoA carboxylase biotin carboxyl carrier protein